MSSVGAAVADGVGAGLFDGRARRRRSSALAAVLAQVVAHALAGAQQVRGLHGDGEAQHGRSVFRRHVWSWHRASLAKDQKRNWMAGVRPSRHYRARAVPRQRRSARVPLLQESAAVVDALEHLGFARAIQGPRTGDQVTPSAHSPERICVSCSMSMPSICTVGEPRKPCAIAAGSSSMTTSVTLTPVERRRSWTRWPGRRHLLRSRGT